MTNRPVHFEIHASDIERASKFYKDVFGWEITRWGDQEYWMIVTGEEDKKNPSKYPGINGGMILRKGEAPVDGQAVNAYVCSIVIDDIDAIILKIEAAGGKLASPKYALPGMAWQAYYKDTEGNIFGLHQPDENAK